MEIPVPPKEVKKPWPLWVKVLVILFSAPFILGGTVNTGSSGWFFATPFIFFILLALPVGERAKVSICGALFLCMVIISSTLGMLKVVFPVLDQQVVLKQDIPVVTRSGEGKTFVDADPNDNLKCIGPFCSSKERSMIPKGEVLVVSRVHVIPATIDFQSFNQFVLSNERHEFIVSSLDNKENFCSKVDWLYCAKAGLLWEDPMRPTFRVLGNLMYYPMVPVILFTALRH